MKLRKGVKSKGRLHFVSKEIEKSVRKETQLYVSEEKPEFWGKERRTKSKEGLAKRRVFL